MNTSELLRLIDTIARDRNVDPELLFVDLEQAMVSAAKKHYHADEEEDFACKIDRNTGEINVWREQDPIDLSDMGRIPAQTAKQVMIQRFREDERDSVFEEFETRIGDLATGTAQRYEGGALIVQIGRAEGFMPRREQIPGEQHQPGERVRCLILDVRKETNQVKIVLSRAAPEMIRRLFEVEVPEVAERIIEIKEMAREPGARTKIAVQSLDSRVDAVGACVGVRGSRIRNIVDELGGEKIDIVRWHESSQVLIANALKPAEVVEISLCFELGRATVVVHEDQLSLAIGKRGQNVRLAARLTNWDVDILTPAEYTRSIDTMESCLTGLEGVEDDMTDRLAALGIISVMDVEEVGAEWLTEQLEMDPGLAAVMVAAASEKAKVVAVEQAADKTASEKKRKAISAMIAGGQDPKAAAEAWAAANPPKPKPGEPSDPAAAAEPLSHSVSHAGEGAIHATDEEAPAEGGHAAPDGGINPADAADAEGPVDPAERADVAGTEEAVAAGVAPSELDAGPPTGDVSNLADPDLNPLGGEPEDIEATEAIQQGGAAEMLADKTDPLQGVVMSDPDEMELPASSEASAEKP
ncbi:transcription termination factor NusA [Phycisphaera mikurensis]|uniref:Transcription termination/antitermination protein NusA n=1 Tax=Phycisphaera mikurensis (strain NBRC 102666 / KCTC 22515 / FYK2301M01) TaxID=1142394 RepID=I0IE57_PHYMF|nr:transcription termination factor NusA [Phycisphaera mikurensis]MBB6441349.1 N utilization substance protein A [Phycisphaera mikurensis]BAM03545.1 transcription elongation protein NusA [Phycisphaera mikurensis NBRC 102666]